VTVLAQLAEPAKAPAGPHPHSDRFHQCRRGVLDCRRHPRGGAIDRRELRIPAHHAADRIQPQSGGAGGDLLGEGLLPVHRADPACHPEAGGAGARARRLFGSHLAGRGWALCGARSGGAGGGYAAAQRPVRQHQSGGRLHAQQRGAACRRARPCAVARRTLHRAFPWARRGVQVERHHHQPAARQFPAAAAANRPIFYDRASNPRCVAAVYAKPTGRYEVARALAFTSPAPQAKALADVPLPPAPIPRPPAPIPTPPVADTAGVTQAYLQARPPKPVQARNIRPVQETRPLF
jgi:hypothetical protein